MDKLKFMIASFISLFVFVTFVSAYPQEVGDFTGLETSNIDGVDLNDLSFTDENIRGPNADECGVINVDNYENLTETTEGVALSSNASRGYIEYELNSVDEALIFFKSPGILDTFSVWYTASVDGGPEQRLEGGTTQRDFGIEGSPAVASDLENATNLTVRIYDQDAVLYDVTSRCRYEFENPDSGSGLIPDFLSEFAAYATGFVSILGSIVGTFFQLLQVSGNIISVTILRLWVATSILGWLYIIAEFVRGND